MNKLNTVFSAASQHMYNAAGQSGAEGANTQNNAAQEGSGDSEVTDVDFEEVKDDNNK